MSQRMRRTYREILPSYMRVPYQMKQRLRSRVEVVVPNVSGRRAWASVLACVVAAAVLTVPLPAHADVREAEESAASPREALTVEVLGPREALLGMPTRQAHVSVDARVHEVANDPVVRAELMLNARPVWRRSFRHTGNRRGKALALSMERLPLWVGENEFVLSVVAESGQTARVRFTLTRNRSARAWPPATAQRERTAPLPAAPQVLQGDRLVHRELVVPAGETLTVRPGTVLRFAPHAGITVHGTLRVKGEADAPVWLVPAELDARWANVVVTGEAAAAAISYTVFYRGGGRANEWREERTVAHVPHVGEPCATPAESDRDNGAAEATGRDGGALMVLGTGTEETRVRVHRSRFLDGLAAAHDREWGLGGGAFVERAAVEMVRTTFAGNHAENDGGALYAFQHARVTLTACRFEGNLAGRDGGAVSAVANEALELEKGHFERNGAGRNGGALNLNADSAAEVRKSRFAENEAARIGGAFLIVRNRRASFEACRFVRNRAGREGGAGTCADDASVSLTACTFARNEAGTTGGGLTIRNSAPRLTDCELTHNRANEPDGAGGIFVRYGSVDEDDEERTGERLTRDELESANHIRNNRPQDLVLE